MANGVFAGVAEGRVADVVGEAGGGYDVANVGGMDGSQTVAFDDVESNGGAEGAPDATGFEAVGEARADVVALGQGEDLCFVLEAAEGGGEDDAVVIPLEGGTLRLRGFGGAFAEARGTEEFIPLHDGG